MDLMTTREAAKVLDVSSDMVRHFERTGQLMALRIPRGNLGPQRLFFRHDVERFQRQRQERLAEKAAVHV